MHGPDFPFATAGQKIGLFGGSFDPPHAGHALVARSARVRFNLDAIWWLVTPGNPLKSRQPAPLAERIAAVKALVRHPRTEVLGIEEQLGTVNTSETIAALQALYPAVHFTWIMGADNLASFHKWNNWREIMARVPVGVVARPGQRLATGSSPASDIFRAARLTGPRIHQLSATPPPAWAFINVPMLDISSTALRQARAQAQAQKGKA